MEKYDIKEVAEMVDKGYDLDRKIKELTAQKQDIGSKLKDIAKESGVKKLQGTYGRCATVSSYSTTTVGTKEFIEYAESYGHDTDSIYSALSVKVTEARRMLGNAVEEIAVVYADDFGKISFTKKEK